MLGRGPMQIGIGGDHYDNSAIRNKRNKRFVGHLADNCKVTLKLPYFMAFRAVRNACNKAGIPRWSPGPLRKTRATQARRDSDLETAQQILGHSSKQTTKRHYAAVDLSRAEANALQFG